MDTRVLEELGLTPGEVKVYLALVGLGETTTGPIVDESGVSISKVYPILNRLAKRGLASHIMKGKVKHFKAADPKRLLDYLAEKENTLKQQEEQLHKLIPKLEIRQSSTVTQET